MQFSRRQLEQIHEQTGQTQQCAYGEGELTLYLKVLFTMESEDRQRWANEHPIAGATVTLGGVTAVSDDNGRVVIDLSTLCDGGHGLSVVPPDAIRTDERAGPRLAEGTAQADMPFWMFRPITGILVLAGAEAALDESSFAAGTDNARFHEDGEGNLTIDWKPDFIQAAAYGDRSDMIDLVVLHRTGGRMTETLRSIGGRVTDIGPTLNTFINGTDDTSAHYLIDRDGFVVKMVQETSRAYHAGVSYWDGAIDINQSSIGIEIVAADDKDGTDEAPDEYFTSAQYNAIVRLFGAFRGTFAVTRHRVVGHSDVNGREDGSYLLGGDRIDCPGRVMDWPWLAARGMGTSVRREADVDERIRAKYGGFFDDTDAQLFYNDYAHPELVRTLQRDLLTIGYSISAEYHEGNNDNGWWKGQELDGVYRPGTEQAVICFRQHFMREADPDGRWYFTLDVARVLEAVLIDLEDG